jgi:acyl-CoA synthetase (AMP-forming)/AMP-acid ligase II
VHPDDVFYLNFTSGTEGDPKGFLHTHNTLLSVLKRFADMQHAADPTAAADVILANSPMSHSFGHLTTYQVLLRGIRMVLVERFSPAETLEIIARERVTAISGTPAHLISLLGHPAFAATDTSSVKSVGVGGAQCPPQLMQDIEAAFGVRIGNMYGMGENILHTRTLPTDPPEVVRETVGLPVPGAELAIFADDHAHVLGVGEVGEVAFRGPTLFLGYYKQPELTRATRNADGWFFTGDLGFVDARGYLHLSGRKKELINRGGTKIFPKEIEDLLHAHPKVVRAAVVGMPDYRLGERVCAYVELAPGETLDLAELRADLVARGVMKHLVPERLEVVEALPLTPTGKVKKAPLTADVATKLEREQRLA